MQPLAEEKADDLSNSVEGSTTPFYPFGIFGKGYILPNKTDRNKLRAILATHVGLGAMLIPWRRVSDNAWIFVLIGGCLVTVSGLVAIIRFLRSRNARPVPWTFAGPWRSALSYGMDRGQLWWMLIAAIVLVGAVLWLMASSGELWTPVAFGAVAFCFAVTGAALYGIFGRAPRRLREDDDAA
jgi:hypothetical protein